jgi:hypothetical protein
LRKGKQIASSSDFTFRLGPLDISGSSKGSGSIRIEPKTKGASACPLGNLRLPRASEDTDESTLTTKQIARANRQQGEEYLAIIPYKSERINKQSRGSRHGLHEIIMRYTMFELGYTFSLEGFISDVFFHYNICIN